MVKSGVVADVTAGPEMAQRYLSVLTDALRMIAAGEGDYISPSLDSQVDGAMDYIVSRGIDQWGEDGFAANRQTVLEGFV
jgi:hypothetical protein